MRLPLASRPISSMGLLMALLVLLQLVTPAAAGWSLLKRAFGLGTSSKQTCKAVQPQAGVDLKTYTGKRWYIHQQVGQSVGKGTGVDRPESGGLATWPDGYGPRGIDVMRLAGHMVNHKRVCFHRFPDPTDADPGGQPERPLELLVRVLGHV